MPQFALRIMFLRVKIASYQYTPLSFFLFNIFLSFAFYALGSWLRP